MIPVNIHKNERKWINGSITSPIKTEAAIPTTGTRLTKTAERLAPMRLTPSV